MSLAQTAILDKTKVPNHAAFQSAIDSTGFDMKLDDFYRPFECSGFVPCVLDGQESGFEMLWQPLNEIFEAWPHLRDESKSRDTALTFIWHGDMRECVCVLIASLALATKFDAVIFYQDDSMLYTIEKLKSEIEEAKKYIK